MTQAVTEATENYLEAIYKLTVEKGAARVKDIAGRVGVAVSTVSGALRSLSAQGLVNYQPYEYVTLTPAGERIAHKVDRRHRLIGRFIREILDVPREMALEEACKLEHGISALTVERLSAFMEFVDTCPRAGAKWIRKFHLFCRRSKFDAQSCVSCMTKNLDELEKRMSSEPSDKQPSVVSLNRLMPGQSGKIKKVRARGPFARRVADMGIVPGSAVRVIKVAPLGDPMEVKIKGYNLSLRKDEAEHIDVEIGDEHAV